MRRPFTALASAVLGTAMAASTVSAQSRSVPTVNPNPPDAPPAAADGATPVNPGRGARHLLRNGWDYITYQNYERALELFREAETRQAELNAAEKAKLKQGIDAAQRAIREAASGIRSSASYALSGRAARPGSMAMADPVKARARSEGDRIQLASAASAPGANPDAANLRATGTADVRAAATTLAEATAPVAAAYGVAVASADPPGGNTPAALPPTPDVENLALPLPADLGGPAQVPVAEPVAAPAMPEPVPAAVQAPAPEPVPVTLSPTAAPAAGGDDIALPTLPPEIESPQAAAPDPAPASAAPVATTPEPAPLLAPEPAASAPVAIPSQAPDAATAAEIPLPSTAATPDPLPLPASPPLSAAVDPTEPQAAAPPVAPAPVAVPTPAPEPAPPAESLLARPDTPPPPMTGAATAPAGSRFSQDSFVPNRSEIGPSGLTPEQQLRVEQIARRQDEEMRRQRDEPAGPDSPNPSAASTRLEISRAPSPTEARPIRAIPVPEEFTPLPLREWNPNRKYWSAAATCHLPLYFQDASLERYGYSMEQRFGRFGRYLSIPIDDPTQSNQRNQIIQPFFSAGLFAAQCALLPYNMFMDPPWEAEYDLGYYRPGDRVPTDIYYLPLTGVGPPLHGSNYGKPPQPAQLPAPRW